MYPNLRAEMARYGYNTKDIAAIIKVSLKTAENKMRGVTAFTVKEAKEIQSKICPKKTLDELFSESIE